MKGTYVLIAKNKTEKNIKIGKIGKIRFEKGYFAYVGSGLNNLKKRIKRHLKDEKNIHWHIDYLLKEIKIKNVFYGQSKAKKECEIAKYLEKNFNSIQNFGSSDCSCKSHLFYSKNREKLEEKIIKGFEKAELDPKEW